MRSEPQIHQMNRIPQNIEAILSGARRFMNKRKFGRQDLAGFENLPGLITSPTSGRGELFPFSTVEKRLGDEVFHGHLGPHPGPSTVRQANRVKPSSGLNRENRCG
jgi:hypothetical protein